MATYYSQRQGRGPLANPSLDDVARVFNLTVEEMSRREYLQEWFGKDCVDNQDDDFGAAAMPMPNFIEMETGHRDAWPLSDPYVPTPEDWAWEVDSQPYEDTLFDLIEFFFLHVSAGVDGEHHSYDGCGWHYKTFDEEPAQDLFRKRINRVLPSYGAGFGEFRRWKHLLRRVR